LTVPCPCCLFLLKSLHLSESEKLFQADGQTTAASQRYCGQLSELFKGNNDNLQGCIRSDHANSHGIRKGSATKVTSGTTLPLPTSSIAARGEWSLGKILDIYWHFAEPGDHYLGRCLAGLYPTSEDFVILPPHFTVGNPMENVRICEAVELMYGPLLQQWAGTKDSDRTALFCKVHPSLVYHSEFLQSTIRRVPGHRFAGIPLPLVNNPALLQDLKELVAIKPSPQISTPTGIPPHVHHAKLTKSYLKLCKETLTEGKSMVADVKKAVCDAIELKAFENGIVTTQLLGGMLKVHHKQIDILITERRKALQTASTPNETATPTPVADNEALDFAPGTIDNDKEAATSTRRIVYQTYSHSGRFWHTPKTFALPPRMKLDTGWKIWCHGIPCYQITADETGQLAPTRMFRHFKNDMLTPISEVMVACPGLDLADEDLFERRIAFLKS
jgi:hypothetical protein